MASELLQMSRMANEEKPKRRQFIQLARLHPFKNPTVVNIFLALWNKRCLK